jgi:cobalamin biosynthesis protein CobD/CbiB
MDEWRREDYENLASAERLVSVLFWLFLLPGPFLLPWVILGKEIGHGWVAYIATGVFLILFFVRRKLRRQLAAEREWINFKRPPKSAE